MTREGGSPYFEGELDDIFIFRSFFLARCCFFDPRCCERNGSEHVSVVFAQRKKGIQDESRSSCSLEKSGSQSVEETFLHKEKFSTEETQYHLTTKQTNKNKEIDRKEEEKAISKLSTHYASRH